MDTPLVLEKKIPQEVRLQNELFGRQRRLPFSITNSKYELVFSLLGEDFAPAVSLKIDALQQECWIALRDDLISAHIFDLFKIDKLDSLPPVALTMAAEALLEGPLHELQQSLGTTVSIQEVRLGAPPETSTKSRLYFQITRMADKFTSVGYLLGEDLIWQSIGRLISKYPIEQVNEFGRVPVPGTIELGTSDMPIKDFNNLVAMDILLLDQCQFLSEQGVILRLPFGMNFKAKLQENRLTIGSIMQDKPIVKNLTAEKPPTGGTSEQVTLNTDEIPIRLTFELGEVDLPLRELKGLKAGYTFELQSSINKPVTIKANRQTIATGELLQIGEQIGVRILEFVRET